MLVRSALAASVAVCSSITWKTKNILAAQTDSEYELRFVQVVFRHGARTPVKVPSYIPITIYEPSLLEDEDDRNIKINCRLRSLDGSDAPSNVMKDFYGKLGELKGGCPQGELTRIGVSQMQELGKYLRKRYVEEMNFLTEEDLTNSIYMRSTCTSRTIKSLQSLLVGLFGDEATRSLDIYTTTEEDETLMMNVRACRYLQKLVRSSMRPTGIPGFEEMTAEVRKALNIAPEVHIDLILIRDNLEVEATHGFSNLEQALNNDQLVKNIKDASVSIMSDFTARGRVTNLPVIIGVFLDELVQNIEDVRKREQRSKKMHLYSSHDITIAPLLSALQIDISEWPAYASNVILELYKKKGSGRDDYFVRVLYNDVVQQIGEDDSTFISLDSFLQLLRPYRVSLDGYKKLCSQE